MREKHKIVADIFVTIHNTKCNRETYGGGEKSKIARDRENISSKKLVKVRAPDQGVITKVHKVSAKCALSMRCASITRSIQNRKIPR